jgi:hypothetical protein
MFGAADVHASDRGTACSVGRDAQPVSRECLGEPNGRALVASHLHSRTSRLLDVTIFPRGIGELSVGGGRWTLTDVTLVLVRDDDALLPQLRGETTEPHGSKSETSVEFWGEHECDVSTLSAAGNLTGDEVELREMEGDPCFFLIPDGAGGQRDGILATEGSQFLRLLRVDEAEAQVEIDDEFPFAHKVADNWHPLRVRVRLAATAAVILG